MLLKFAIKDFLDDAEFRNLRPVSIKSYKYTLEQFHQFCVEQGVTDTSEVTVAIVKKYLLWCKKQGTNNPTSLNHKLRNLRVFFNYLISIDVITSKQNPATKVDYQKEDVEIQFFTEEHIRKMLGYYRRLKRRGGELYAYRNHTIIITLLSTGMRLGDLCNLKWSDIDFHNGSILLVGKARRQTAIPAVDKLLTELAEYKVYLETVFEEPSDYVFVNRFNKPLTPDGVKNIFKVLRKAMNFKDVRLSAHTFRHTFAINLVLAGADAFTVQTLLRHSTLNMTMRYVNLYGQHLADKNDKYNPLNNMKLD